MTEIIDAGPARLTIPVLTLRGLTVFPQLLLHFDVARDISIRALEEAMDENREIFPGHPAGFDSGKPGGGGPLCHRHRGRREADPAFAREQRPGHGGRPQQGTSCAAGVIGTISDSRGGTDPRASFP